MIVEAAEKQKYDYDNNYPTSTTMTVTTAESTKTHTITSSVICIVCILCIVWKSAAFGYSTGFSKNYIPTSAFKIKRHFLTLRMKGAQMVDSVWKKSPKALNFLNHYILLTYF